MGLTYGKLGHKPTQLSYVRNWVSIFKIGDVLNINQMDQKAYKIIKIMLLRQNMLNT